MRYAIGIVNFNGDIFLEKQIQRIRKYLLLLPGDTLDILVADNSRTRGCSTCHGEKKNLNKSICDDYGMIYLPMNFDEGDNSAHHALALNYLYETYKQNFNYLLFLDHDLFPVDYSDILTSELQKTFIGLAQQKGETKYLHPAILRLNLDNLNGQSLDFLPSAHLDTGGKLADLINDENTSYLSISYVNYDDDFYEFIGGKFMHFIKGSNWNGNPNHKNRLNFLFKELERVSR